MEAVAQEVAPFGISITIIEPGPTQTGFGAALDHAPATALYEATPAGAVRRAMADGSFVLTGDADRSVDAMIAAADAGVNLAKRFWPLKAEGWRAASIKGASQNLVVNVR